MSSSEKSKSKLVLIDGHAIMHRAYHALPQTMTTQKGEPINAVYGFVSMLFRIIQDLKPTHIAFCFDRKEPTFRKQEYKEYQAHRPKIDDDLVSQFKKARLVAKVMDIPVYDKAGFEADDVIGTLAKQAVKGIDEVVIVTGDRDILQLIDDKVKVYLPIKGLSNSLLMGEKEVKEKMGVSAKQIVDYKALVGDPSDNYKGVAGIGPKTAEKLLKEYRSFKAIYKNLRKIDERTKKKLLEGKESGEISYKLARIVTNVPVKLSIGKVGKWKLDKREVFNLFEKFNFKTLTKRAKSLGKKIDEKKQMRLI